MFNKGMFVIFLITTLFFNMLISDTIGLNIVQAAVSHQSGNLCDNTVAGSLVSLVTSSSYSSNYPPSLAVDGDTATRWGANRIGASPYINGPWFFQVKFTSPQTFNKVRLKEYGGRIKDYIIKVSNDGINWSEAAIGTLRTSEGGTLNSDISFNTLTKQYIQLYVTNVVTAANTPIIYEFEAYNDNTVVQVTGVNLNKTSSTLLPNTTEQLSITSVLPPEANQNVTWVSDNTAVATVNSTGLVTTVGYGSAHIRAKNNMAPSIYGECIITVLALPAQSVSITNKPIGGSCYVGNSISLIASILPSEANQGITWSSDNSAVASVNVSGLISFNSVGSAVIQAKSSTDSTKFDTWAVTVKQQTFLVSGVVMSTTAASVYLGSSVQLTTSVVPAQADQGVIWSSNNTSIASVNGGLVTGMSLGTATISALSVASATYSATCLITVTRPPVSALNIISVPSTIFIDGTLQLASVASPPQADQTVTWSSYNTQVATVNTTTGLVTGVSEGSAVIRATSVTNATYHADYLITVTSAPVASLGLNRNVVVLQPTKTFQLNATILPLIASQGIIWSTDNQNIATVVNGLLTGISEGQTVIKAVSVANSVYSDECSVTIKSAISTTKDITSFFFQGLSPAVEGIIDQNNNTISLDVPYGTNLQNIAATFTTNGLSIYSNNRMQTSGVTMNNLTNTVAYTVYAEDNTYKDYTIKTTWVDTERANLVLNKNTTANSIYASSYLGAMAVDGDSTSSRWATKEVTAAWLNVDFGARTRFNSASVYDYRNRVQSYKIQYSDDAVNWYDAFISTSAIGMSQTSSFAAVDGRYVRLNILQATAGPSIYEFQVYYKDKNHPPRSVPDNDQTSSWVHMGADDKLEYTADSLGNKIIDFSYAGYGGGGTILPNGTVKVTVNPSGGDDTAFIQDAINQVAAMPMFNGLRGAVLLSSGTFNVGNTIYIRDSGIVVRGSGDGTTVIKMTESNPFLLFNVAGSGTRELGNPISITDSYVASGTRTINVSDVSGFNIGDSVYIGRTVTTEWIRSVGMDTLVRDGAPQVWIPAGTVIGTDRVITALSGNTITLDAPLTDSFDATYLGSPVGTISKYTLSGRITNVGLEYFKIEAPKVLTAYQSVSMDIVEDAWVRNITIQDGISCFSLGNDTKRITVDSVIIMHTIPASFGAPPADFAVNGTQILFNKCQSLGSGIWPIVSQGKSNGPLVILNFYSTQSIGIAPHQRWYTGILADNCYLPNATEGVAFRNRGTFGSGHGWTTAWSVAWNVVTPAFHVTQAPGTKNWSIGSIGGKVSSTDPMGTYDNFNATVAPYSLYLQQLKDRLGQTALNNIGYGNLAVNKNVTASTKNSMSEATPRANDGNIGTYWSAIEDASTNQWLAIDFGANITFDKVVVKETLDQRITAYKLQFSDNGINYSDIVGTSGTVIGSSKCISFENVTTRYLRIYIVSASDSPRINEIEVYKTDTTLPVITLTGNSTICIKTGETYTDQGATANDDIDGNITSRVVTNNTVNSLISGIYIVTYNVSDTTENYAKQVVRTVVVTAVESVPIISPNVNLSTSNKYISITPATLALAVPITVSVPSNVIDSKVSVAELMTSPVAGVVSTSPLPEFNISAQTSLSTTPVQIVIPQGLKISAQMSDNWDGTINVPKVLATNTVIAVADSQKTASVDTVIEIGYGDVPLILSKAVRILIPGMAGKEAAYYRGTTFTKITSTISSDTQISADEEIVAGGDAVLNSGSDMIIWTKHFTKFVAYTQTGIASGSTGGGDGGDGDIITPVIIPTITTQQPSITLTPQPSITPIPMVDVPLPTKTPANFKDILEHWAVNDINKLILLGVVEGYPDGTFKPDNDITRAEFVKLLVGVLKLQITSGKVFTDTVNHWAKDYVGTANAYGIISGYSETIFGPDDKITREQMIFMVVNGTKMVMVSDETLFTDNKSISQWATSAVNTAKRNGIINGYPDKSFKPLVKSTRGEAAVVLVKAMEWVK